MALSQRKNSNTEHLDIEAPQVHQEQPDQPQQPQVGQEELPQAQPEQTLLMQPEKPQQALNAIQQEQVQQSSQAEANSDSTASAIPSPSKEQLLLKMLQDYKSHLSPDEKPKNVATHSEAELLVTDEKQPLATTTAAVASPAPVAIDQLTAKKLLALDNLIAASNNLIEQHDANKLFVAFGAYEQALEKVRGWNPATGIGLKYTHGKKLVLGIRNLFPEIDNEAAYLAGKTMQVLENYVIAKHQDVHAVGAVQEDKKISVENKLISKCKELFLSLERIDYDDHQEILEILQKVMDHTAKLYELVYQFNAKNTGFIASVTSKLTTIPEDQLLIDLNSVKDKHEELFVNKQVPQL